MRSVGPNTDLECICYKSPEIMLNIPGQLPFPVTPISEDASNAQ